MSRPRRTAGMPRPAPPVPTLAAALAAQPLSFRRVRCSVCLLLRPEDLAVVNQAMATGERSRDSIVAALREIARARPELEAYARITVLTLASHWTNHARRGESR